MVAARRSLVLWAVLPLAAAGGGARREDAGRGTGPAARLPPLLRSERPISRHVASARSSLAEVRSRRPEETQDCAYGQWAPWSPCSLSCGGGARQRRREKLREARGAGLQCSEGQEEEGPCNEQGCPVDCLWHPWQPWLGCSATCGGGRQSRVREPEREAENDGAPCAQEAATEQRPCETRPCPVDCEWSPWSPWGDCSRECAGGRQAKTRHVQTTARYNGSQCTGDAEEERECNAQVCDTDCRWGLWSNYTECNATCGGGWHEARRRPDVEQSGRGSPCIGESVDWKRCNTHPCPVDCVWADWGDWAQCSTSCGGGSAVRRRSVEVHANAEGRQCEGNDTENQDCHPEPCPIDCHWEDWQPWSRCSVSCHQGERHRSRNKVREEHNGRPCAGPMVATELCWDDTHCLHDAPDGQAPQAASPDAELLGELSMRVSDVGSLAPAARRSFENAVGDAIWELASGQPPLESVPHAVEVSVEPSIPMLPPASLVWRGAAAAPPPSPPGAALGQAVTGADGQHVAAEAVARYRIPSPPPGALGALRVAPLPRLAAVIDRQLDLHRVAAYVEVTAHSVQGGGHAPQHPAELGTTIHVSTATTTAAPTPATAATTASATTTTTTSATTSRETFLQEVEDIFFGKSMAPHGAPVAVQTPG